MRRLTPCIRPVLPTLVLLACLAGSASPCMAGEWRGWRGVERQGRAETSVGPVHWSPTTNIAWRTAIPGEGHSSPIVTRDTVYVTAAREIPANRVILRVARLDILAALLLLGILADRLIIHCCARPDYTPLARLSLFGLAAAVLFTVVLFAEGLAEFGRGAERGWAAASVVGALCLVVCRADLPASSRLRGLLAFAGVVFASLIALSVPQGHRAFEQDLLDAKSCVAYLVIALPLLAGLTGAPRQASRILRVAGWLCFALFAAVAVALVVAICGAQRVTAGTTGVSQPYQPVIRWWLPVGLAMVSLALTFARRRCARGRLFTSLGVISAAIVLGLVTGFTVIEQLLAHVRYLDYTFSGHALQPLLGWRAVAVIAAVKLIVVIVALVGAMRGRIGACRLPMAFRVVAAVLALTYFGYARYLPKGPVVTREIVAVDRQTGAVRWVSQGLSAPSEDRHTDNSAATPTPVTDGQRVFAYFGTPGVICTDTGGKTLWTSPELPYATREGVASSPILCDGRLIIVSESDAGAWLGAFDCATGNALWRTPRTHAVHADAGNCRTPTVQTVAGRPQIVVWGYEDVSGYDPATGQELWSHHVGRFGESANPVASPVSDGRRLYLAGPTKTVALDLDKLPGSASPIAWERETPDGAQCSSPALRNELVFAVSDNGTAYCLAAGSGEFLWSRPLDGQYYSSVTAIGDRIYLPNTRGVTTVLSADRQGRELAQSDLGEGIYASPAPVDGALLIRTKQHLYCVRER